MTDGNERHILDGTFLGNVENFKRTLLSVNDGVYLTDRERRIIFWNDACESITGYGADEVLGRRCSDNILNHVDMNGNRLCESEHCPLYQSMMTGRPSEKPVVVRALRRDHSRVTVEVSVSPLLGEDGKVVGGIEVFRDVTEKHQLAEMKSEFLSSLSHELKGPMTIIQGFLELVLTGSTGDINPLQREFLSSAYKEGDRFKKIMNDLSDLARFETTEFSFQFSPVDLSDLLRLLAGSYRGEAASKGIELIFEIEEGMTIFGDENRLYQAFSNLLSNALKYTPEGTVTVHSSILGGSISVTVRDSGIGIAKKDLDRVFDLFYRAEHPLTKEIDGTGIGLSIVQKIIHRHDGAISVESEPGRGSSFTVTVPLGVGDNQGKTHKV